jgi:putative CocE/NonD family hydrolase
MTTPTETEQPRAITIDFDVPATMRDGTVLRANVYRPTGEGHWPALLIRTPYGKEGVTGELDPVQAARRGYVVVAQDARGCGSSEGEWVPFAVDVNDGADTVAWAAALPYADGQAGMFGSSYNGFTQWAAASQQPAAFKAMVPWNATGDPFDGVFYRGGAFELGLHANWNLGLAFGVLARRHQDAPDALGEAVRRLSRELDALVPVGYWSLPLAQFAPLRRHDVGPFFFDLVAGAMDRTSCVWDATNVPAMHDRVQAATFNIGGWYDSFLPGAIANFTAMRARGQPTRLLIGPWIHSERSSPVVGQLNFGFGSQLGAIDLGLSLSDRQLRWFDHWLKGIDTGMMAEPPIKLFVMGANLWRDEEEWPLARAVDTRYYLRAGGHLSQEPPDAEVPDQYDYDPAHPVPTLGGACVPVPEFAPGPNDQRPIEARPDVLVYTTSPLEHDVEVTGPIEVQLWATSSAPDTDFVARLVDVHPDGRSINLTDGIIRARYRDFRKGEPPSLIEPGRPYAYAIDLWATSNVFKAGHRIGLQVTSSCFPRWDRNPNTGHAFGADAELRVAHQEILHDNAHPSYVRLPFIPME